MIQRRNIGICILLTIVTCGIYGLYWMACMAEDANLLSGRPGTSGGMVVLLTIVTCGIYGMFWLYQVGEILDESRQRNNIPTGHQAILYLLLGLFGFGIISYALIQSELNKYTPNPTNV